MFLRQTEELDPFFPLRSRLLPRARKGDEHPCTPPPAGTAAMSASRRSPSPRRCLPASTTASLPCFLFALMAPGARPAPAIADPARPSLNTAPVHWFRRPCRLRRRPFVPRCSSCRLHPARASVACSSTAAPLSFLSNRGDARVTSPPRASWSASAKPGPMHQIRPAWPPPLQLGLGP